MPSSTLFLPATDGLPLFVHRWLPDEAPKAVVQIAHGLAEHGGRYARLAGALTSAGYAVWAGDHRGHGRTARTSDELGFFAERDGWRKCIDDLWQINKRIAAEHPGLPIVLIGHSMGSFMAQQFLSEYGDMLAGVVLSGSTGRPAGLTAMRMVARIERLRLGARKRSKLINALSFGAFNKPFAPARTPVDWLSRDEAEIDKYLADPLCTFLPSVRMWIDVLDALHDVTRTARLADIPKRLSIDVIAGTRDPVSAETKTLIRLLAAYRAVGLERVTHRFYPDARHELFHEINRNEVTRDVLKWLDGVIG